MRWAIVVTRSKKGLTIESATNPRINQSERRECEEAFRAICALPRTALSRSR